MAQAGTVLGGRYVLDDQIGYGGYGEVWRATDTVLTRPVAVKLLHPRYAQRSEALARFRAEARHAGGVSHENIAQVFDYGEPADGQPPYLVMELVDGPSLETVLTGGPLDDRRTMDIVAQAAAGLQAAHAAGMIHRDIKPGNLLLAPGGTVKITDFGIAHTIGSAPLTASGELIGTPGYLAPERAMGEPATPASDLYSLGMLAYECLAATPPFRGTPLEVALAHRDRPLPPLPPSVAVGVATLVMRLAAKDPAHRPNDAAETAVWAGLLRDGVGVSALQMWPEQPPVAGLFQRRTILAYACVAVTAVVVIVLASVIGFASTPRPVAAPAPVSSSHGGGSGGGDVDAPPARGSATAPPTRRPAASPGQVPAARSVAKRRPAAPNPNFGPAVAAANPAGPDPGHGQGKGPGPGAGPGPGHGKAKGKGNSQDD
ncbi:MAG TPA: protein kinase [Streptosporangiaceae bacterium]|nr:protein kinase [Streptosporangiaceae bacterium]